MHNVEVGDKVYLLDSCFDPWSVICEVVAHFESDRIGVRIIEGAECFKTGEMLIANSIDLLPLNGGMIRGE